MTRHRPDTADLTDRIVDEAERLLVETQGRRLVLSEIAARIGISQSYVHRFFPTKADLIRTLAARWFAEVEAASARAAHGPGDPGAQLETWLLAILRLKRARYDADPALFDAYLDLAADHMDLVRAHAQTLSADLRAILARMVPPARLDAAVQVAEDATLLFRTPIAISRYRALATDDRARAVVAMLRAYLPG